MGLPIVAIVGRPNVGKSSLLNCLAGRLVSIVEPTPGVTRDRVSTVCEEGGVYFELVDTGGYGVEDRDNLTEHIERQIRYALDQSSLVLFVLDVRDGIMPLDRAVAELLRPFHERVIVVANKVDEPFLEAEAGQLLRLGYGEPQTVSALHKRGRGDLREVIVERLRAAGLSEAAPGDPIMKVAVIGRQNTGKSTFINALAGTERVIVSEIPGTTRDAVDLQFEVGARTFVAIDTAGVKKKSRWGDPIDYYGYTRVLQSIRRADVTLLFIDSTQEITSVDKRLAGLMTEEYKPCVVVINKWDLAIGRAGADDYGKYLSRTIPNLDYAPMVFVSARDGHNIDAAVDTAWSLFKQARTRVSTGQLNQVLTQTLAERGPSAKRGSRPPRIYYATQVGIQPPTLVLFVNSPGLVKRDYQRYLLNRLQTNLPFNEVPIRMIFRASRGRGPGGGGSVAGEHDQSS